MGSTRFFPRPECVETMSMVFPNVAEVQGLYGPFSFSEKLLQKIWLRGDFDRMEARTTDGRRVHVFHPGKWNLLGGPDFHGARFAFDDGGPSTGDVELHLHASDWTAHGHAHDPAYNNVRLHVVLFPPRPGEVTRGAGEEIPMLALLPLLHHDLEAFAADDAVESLAQRPSGRVLEVLGRLSAVELIRLLREHGEQRWRLKVHFARQRLSRLGWTAACHHAALEILGYRFNRAPMLRLAGRFPLEAWTTGVVDAAQAWTAEAESWSVQGVRPANQPRARLEQYMKWSKARPDWPDRLAETLSTWPTDIIEELGTRRVRREHRFAERRACLADACCAAVVGGTRFDTLMTDGWLPLFNARFDAEKNLGRVWTHWFAGDLPPWVLKSLRQLVVFSSEQPACTGLAQGLLGWDLRREAAMVARLGRGA